jgi:hypothetical protein
VARKTQHSFAKRQREQKKAEKAAQKRAKREERLNPASPESEVVDGEEMPTSSDVDSGSNAELPKTTDVPL